MQINEHSIEWDVDTIARLWDYYARHEPYRGQYFSDIFGQSILHNSRLPLLRQLKVLDFGCGPGFMLDKLRALGARWVYTGIDFSSASISALRTKGIGTSLFEAGIHVTELPSQLPNRTFDVVLIIEVIEHLSDNELFATLTEARRLLKPGGHIVVTTPNNEDLSLLSRFCPACGAVFHQWQHVRSWTNDTVSTLLVSHGFEPVRLTALNLAASTFWKRITWRAISMLRRKHPHPHLLAVFRRPVHS